MSFSITDSSVLSYDIVSMLSYDKLHQIFVVMAMKSRVNLGVKFFRRALSLLGSLPTAGSFILEHLNCLYYLGVSFIGCALAC